MPNLETPNSPCRKPRSVNENRLGWATPACLTVLIFGVALTLVGFFASFGAGWGPSFLAPGATVIAAGTGGYVAVRSVVTWREQRLRDRKAAEDKHREDVYEEIASVMVGRFLGPEDDLRQDSALRSKAALWGSSATVRALAAWQAEITKIKATKDDLTDGTMPLSEDESLQLKNLLGDALVAMRADLSPVDGFDGVAKEDLLGSIFNETREPQIQANGN